MQVSLVGMSYPTVLFLHESGCRDVKCYDYYYAPLHVSYARKVKGHHGLVGFLNAVGDV